MSVERLLAAFGLLWYVSSSTLPTRRTFLTVFKGPSGSGKTSLLNSLACRLDRGMKIDGELKLNGRDYSRTELKWVGGYVMQDDVLNAHLTVQETLMYTAQLRLPPGLSKEVCFAFPKIFSFTSPPALYRI